MTKNKKKRNPIFTLTNRNIDPTRKIPTPNNFPVPGESTSKIWKITEHFEGLYQYYYENIVVKDTGPWRKGAWGGHQPSPFSLYFLKQKLFFLIKSKNIEFFHVNNIWGFSLFTEQDLVTKSR